MSFNYYSVNDHQEFYFLQVPKIMMYAERYKRLSAEAKLLYGHFIDRQRLSIKNNWADENGHIFFICTNQEIMELFSCSEKTAKKYKDELVSVGLYQSKKMGMNRANRSYVAKLDISQEDAELIARFTKQQEEADREEMIKQGVEQPPETEEKELKTQTSLTAARTGKNYGSGTVKITGPERENLQPNNNYINNNDLKEFEEEEDILLPVITESHIINAMNQLMNEWEITNQKTINAALKAASKCKVIGTTDWKTLENYVVTVVEEKMQKFGKNQKVKQQATKQNTGTTVRKEVIAESIREQQEGEQLTEDERKHLEEERRLLEEESKNWRK